MGHKYTNRLINELSPYLLQHAHNPVEWYPWCEDAFEKASHEDKPVLLSIGYSACHWCHVMERESFENEDIAGIMNRLFNEEPCSKLQGISKLKVYQMCCVLFLRHIKGRRWR